MICCDQCGEWFHGERAGAPNDSFLSDPLKRYFSPGGGGGGLLPYSRFSLPRH